MKMPKMTAERSMGTSKKTYVGLGNSSILPAESLETASIFGKISCLSKCGINALSCLHCGTNLKCWAGCAGVGSVSCISDCF